MKITVKLEWPGKHAAVIKFVSTRDTNSYPTEAEWVAEQFRQASAAFGFHHSTIAEMFGDTPTRVSDDVIESP